MGDSVAITLGPWSGAACTGLRNVQILSPKRENSGLVVASMKQNHRSVAWGPASRPSPSLAQGTSGWLKRQVPVVWGLTLGAGWLFLIGSRFWAAPSEDACLPGP